MVRSLYAEYATVRQEGARQVERELEHYDHEAIIAVGYRVNSARRTHSTRSNISFAKSTYSGKIWYNSRRLVEGKDGDGEIRRGWRLSAGRWRTERHANARISDRE